jgi:hypothetical protein
MKKWFQKIPFLIVVICLLGAAAYLSLRHTQKLKQDQAKVAILKQFNTEIIPLYQQKATILERYFRPSPTHLLDLHSKLTLTRQWSAKEAQDLIEIEEIVGYIDQQAASLLPSLKPEVAQELLKEMDPLDRQIRSFQSERRALAPDFDNNPLSPQN